MSFAVAHNADFERVRDLPWRVLTQAEADARAAALTPELAVPGGGATLLPWQGYSLHEAREVGGAWLALPVGAGKTLISFLLPLVLEADRALLIMKGKTLIDKTFTEFREFRGRWRFPERPTKVVTLEWLSTEGAANFLDTYDPDLIIIDEVDDLASTRNAAVVRIDRFVRQKRAARGRYSVKVVGMTGTPMRKSLMGIWHVLGWCLDDGMPMPLREKAAWMWDLAIGNHKGRRPSPGPLGATVDDAREYFRQRLAATPGVVIVDGDSCGAPLTIRVRLARECPDTDAQFERFLVEQENPGGIPVSDPLGRALLDGQIGLGLYSYWDPPPPEAWRVAWRAMAAFARNTIDSSQRGHRPIETLAQVIRRHSDHPVVVEWLRVKGLFVDQANRRTAWFSRAALDSCLDWLRELDRPGIVMCGSVEFGAALAREARLPYYSRQGRTHAGQSILHADRTRSFVASWQANKKGLNLQDQPHLGLRGWPRQLIVMPPSSAKWLEQVIGRVHRRGQVDPVRIDILATSGGTLDLFEAAIQEASVSQSLVTLTQKILRAEIVRATPKRTAQNAFRWARKGEHT